MKTNNIQYSSTYGVPSRFEKMAQYPKIGIQTKIDDTNKSIWFLLQFQPNVKERQIALSGF